MRSCRASYVVGRKLRSGGTANRARYELRIDYYIIRGTSVNQQFRSDHSKGMYSWLLIASIEDGRTAARSLDGAVKLARPTAWGSPAFHRGRAGPTRRSRATSCVPPHR